MRQRGSAVRWRIGAALALVLAATAGKASDAPAATPASAEAYAELPFINEPVLSPDGVSIAAKALVAGKTKLVVFRAADMSQPPRVFEMGDKKINDRKAGRMDPIAQPFTRLANVALAPVSAVHYAARDGLSLPAYLTMPLHRGDKALPLVIMPHGGPFARDDWEYDPFVQFLANRGYVVLQPQFRGSTGYGKAFVEKGYGQWGRKMQDDVDDGVDWLVKSGKVDPRRVCIMGASYGGYAALWGAIRNPEKYRCAISFAGVTDIDAILRYDRRSFSAPRYFKRWQTKIAGEDKIDLDTVSPLAQAARLTIPVLIAQGEKDTTVPPRQAHQMVAALTRAHANLESVFYKEEAHGFSKPENMADFLRRMDAFLHKHNPS
jgi:dipeptidyl aminopeptidase/acylaminoacyl peptidase